MADIKDVAQYILESYKDAYKKSMTTMKLQKLTYYSQAWHLVWDNVALFPQDFQAWRMGPVSRDLWLLHAGSKFIDCNPGIVEASSDRLTPSEKESVDAVVERYGFLKGVELSELVHAESPWLDARGNLTPFEDSQALIPKSSMRKFYAAVGQ